MAWTYAGTRVEVRTDAFLKTQVPLSPESLNLVQVGHRGTDWEAWKPLCMLEEKSKVGKWAEREADLFMTVSNFSSVFSKKLKPQSLHFKEYILFKKFFRYNVSYKLPENYFCYIERIEKSIMCIKYIHKTL